MSKRTCVSKELNEQFNEKEIVLGEVADPSQCGKLVQNHRMAIATKDMVPPPGFKDHSPRPDNGNWRSRESYLYLTAKGSGMIMESFDGKSFDAMMFLSSEQDSLEAGKNDHTFHASDRMHKRVVDLLVRRKKDLPKVFADMSDKELAACVRPPYSLGYVDKNKKKRGPSLRVGFKHYAEDPKKGKPENMVTRCYLYDGVDDEGDDVYREITKDLDAFHDLVSDPETKKFVFGDMEIAICVQHLGFSVKLDKKTGNIKKSINYALTLENFYFKPSESSGGGPEFFDHKISRRTTSSPKSSQSRDNDIKKDELRDVEDHYENEDDVPRKSRSRGDDEEEKPTKSRSRGRGDDEDEEPRKRSRSDEEEPRKRSRGREEEPRKRRRDAEDDDDEEDEPRSTRRRK